MSVSWWYDPPTQGKVPSCVVVTPKIYLAESAEFGAIGSMQSELRFGKCSACVLCGSEARNSPRVKSDGVSCSSPLSFPILFNALVVVQVFIFSNHTLVCTSNHAVMTDFWSLPRTEQLDDHGTICVPVDTSFIPKPLVADVTKRTSCV